MASQASRYAARLAGAVVGGAIGLDLGQEGDDGAAVAPPRRRPRRRPGLLRHVRVEVKDEKGLQSLPVGDRPSWLPLPLPPPPPPLEEQPAPPDGGRGQRPLVFVTAADDCLLDNLVEDLLQLDLDDDADATDGGSPRVHVSFGPECVCQLRMLRREGREGEEEGSSWLTRLWEGLGLVGRPIVEPPWQGPGEIGSLAEVGRLLSASPSAGGTVVVDVTALTAAAAGTDAGEAAGAVLRELFEWAHAEPQRRYRVVFAAASPLALWKAQLLATGEGALPGADAAGADKAEGKESSKAAAAGGDLLGAPVLHVQVLGMNRALVDLLVSEAVAVEGGEGAQGIAAEEGKEEEEEEEAAGAPGASKQWESAFLEEGADEAPPPAEAEASADSPVVVDANAALAPLLRLAPRLDALLDALNSSSNSSSLDAAVGRKAARLRAALGATGEQGSSDLGVLLWDVLGLLHGERLDAVARARLGLGGAEQGALPLEVVVHWCSEEPELLGKLEALMAAGWLQPTYPELMMSAAASPSSSPPPPPTPAGEAGAGDGGSEDQPPASSSSTTTAEPAVLCRASLDPLGRVPLPFANTTLITTPALATLAWRRAVAGDADVAAQMDARSGARYVAQQAAVLQGQRLALQAEWAQLAEGRRALGARRGELGPGEFAALQLELIRLEKGAASRAYEMRHRARHLNALRARLAEAAPALLPASAVPPAEALAAPNVHAGYPSLPLLSIEERVLVDVDRGLRGVPVEWVEGGGAGGRRGLWMRVRGWGARLWGRAERKGSGEVDRGVQ